MNGTVTAAPNELDLTFSEGVNPKFTGAKLTGPDKSAVNTGEAKLGAGGDATLIVAGWQARTPAFLMTVTGRWWLGETAPPQGFEVQHLSFQGAVQLTVHAEGGQLADQGVVGRVGRTVVFDQVVTEPAFRRLGLGSFVMRELARRAFIEGATEHLLIATEEGRALYERLGWTVLSDVVSLVSPSAAIESAGELEGIAAARCAT